MKKRTGILVFAALTLAVAVVPLESRAQYNYNPDLPARNNLALGVRIGGTSGVTAKYFYKNNTALEGLIGAFGNGFSLTGMIEKQLPIYNAPGFYVYYGGGAHLAFYNGNDRYRFGREVDTRNVNDVGFGIDGLIGLEYRLPKDIPVGFSVDLKPFVEVGTGGYVSVAPDPSIGIKFFLR